jgi:hypothetical protein
MNWYQYILELHCTLYMVQIGWQVTYFCWWVKKCFLTSQELVGTGMNCRSLEVHVQACWFTKYMQHVHVPIQCTMHKYVYWSTNVRILFPDTCTNLLVSVVIGHGSLTCTYMYHCYSIRLFVYFMVFNATFNNISVIPWRSVLLVEEADKLYHIMLYTSPWQRFELTTSAVIAIDCIGSCKSNYHTITSTKTLIA